MQRCIASQATMRFASRELETAFASHLAQAHRFLDLLAPCVFALAALHAGTAARTAAAQGLPPRVGPRGAPGGMRGRGLKAHLLMTA